MIFSMIVLGNSIVIFTEKDCNPAPVMDLLAEKEHVEMVKKNFEMFHPDLKDIKCLTFNPNQGC
jgi:hypothetical protein